LGVLVLPLNVRSRLLSDGTNAIAVGRRRFLARSREAVVLFAAVERAGQDYRDGVGSSMFQSVRHVLVRRGRRLPVGSVRRRQCHRRFVVSVVPPTGVWWYLRLFRRPNHVGPESARRARGRLERRLQARLRRRQKYRLRYFLAAQQHYVQRLF